MILTATKSPTETQKAVLTVADVIAATGLSRGAVYDAVRRREIPSVRVGRRVLIPRHAFERWLAGEFDAA